MVGLIWTSSVKSKLSCTELALRKPVIKKNLQNWKKSKFFTIYGLIREQVVNIFVCFSGGFAMLQINH